MTSKSVLQEAREVQLASTLIHLGARLQFLQDEVDLSRDRLVRLYKEIKGVSPPKGLLPFSADWYMTWLANIHASLFFNVYEQIAQRSDAPRLECLIHAYEMYLEHVRLQDETPVLDFTRACTLVRFHARGMVKLTACTQCSGRFITHANEWRPSAYVCVLCRPPARAGKPGRARRLPDAVAAEGCAEATEPACAGALTAEAQ